MAEEIGIVMSLYDRVSPTLKAIAGESKAFDKSLQSLETATGHYEKAQQNLSKRTTELRTALAAAGKEVESARKEYKKLGDETSKQGLDAAIEEQERLKQQLKDTAVAMQENQKSYKSLVDQVRRDAVSVRRSMEDSMPEEGLGGGAGAASVMTALKNAGITKMLGDSLAQAAGAGIESALGQPTASFVSSVVSGAASGAALGSIVPGIGTAIGAGVGALSGVISGGSQVFQSRDDAFKSYVQEQAENQLSEMTSIRQSGSATAGQREQDQIAFAQRFGSDAAAQEYLSRVRAMAVDTNYSYDEITGYSKSLLNTYSAEETLGILQQLSDASAGLNLDSSGVAMFINGLSRMRTTGKVTQEYLNYFSERGLDVYSALAEGTGADKSGIADMVSKGKINGADAAQYILDYIQEQFGGLSEKLASTYDAMVDNLGDAEDNLNAMMGEGYNQARKAGIQAQTEWMESDQMGMAYQAIGAWQAQLENSREQYIRDAMDAMMTSAEYLDAQFNGDVAEMGRLMMQAKVQGMNEYNASEGAQLALESEMALAGAIRDDTASDQAYWDAGYRKSQEFSKGLAAGLSETWKASGGYDSDHDPAKAFVGDGSYDPLGGRSYATGLERVPYNNFPALLHEGERVLTAQEARSYDQGGGGIQIVMNGTVIREDADVYRLAQELLAQLRQAKTAGVYGWP